ncbi:hypothetical protein BHE74_00033372, partial [Ensete ventricosum]
SSKIAAVSPHRSLKSSRVIPSVVIRVRGLVRSVAHALTRYRPILPLMVLRQLGLRCCLGCSSKPSLRPLFSPSAFCSIMLDINLFRAEKGFDPELVRESQRRRFASVEVVEEIIHLDREWRQRTDLDLSFLDLLRSQFELDGLRRDANRLTKEVKNLKIVSSAAQNCAGKDATEVISSTDETKKLIAAKELEVQEAKATLDSKLETIGNLIHDSAENAVIRTWGEKRTEGKLKNHVDLVKLLDIVDLEKGILLQYFFLSLLPFHCTRHEY